MSKIKRFFLFFMCVSLVSGHFIYPKKLVELSEPMRVDMMATDGEHLFILDNYTVHIYAFKGYEYLGKFGKKGKGPGEFDPNFLERLILQIDGDDVVLNTWNKIARFSKEGKLKQEKVIPFLATQVVPLGKNYVITKYIQGQKGINQLAVQICDEQFQQKKTLYQREDIVPQRSGKLDCPNEQIFVTKTGFNIFTYDQRPGTHFFIYDLQGNMQQKIALPFKAMKMPQSFKDEVMDWMEASIARIRSFSQMAQMSIEQLKQMVYYHNMLPGARFFTVQNKNIIIETYSKKENRSQFMTLDFYGKELKEFFMADSEPGRVKMTPHATYCLYKNNYYYLKENLADETWELHKETF